jgi:hypothetical protein
MSARYVPHCLPRPSDRACGTISGSVPQLSTSYRFTAIYWQSISHFGSVRFWPLNHNGRVGTNASVLFGIALLVASVDADIAPPPIAVLDTKFQAGTAEQAIAVSRMIGGIISYTRWPADLRQLQFCISGDTQVALQAAEIDRSANRSVALKRVAAGAATDGCDILYLGPMAPVRQRQMVSGIRARAVLSIAESDPSCRGGTMFCLRIRSATLAFQLNVDAISRGTVRVDPRVLRITAARGNPA